MDVIATRAAYEAGMKAGWIAAKLDVNETAVETGVMYAIRESLKDSTSIDDLETAYQQNIMTQLSKAGVPIVRAITASSSVDESYNDIEYELASSLGGVFVKEVISNLKQLIGQTVDVLKKYDAEYQKLKTGSSSE